MATTEGVQELNQNVTAEEEDKGGKEEYKVLYDASKQDKVTDLIEGAQSLLTVVVLVLCCMASFSSRLFAIIRFESIIHEFDPWFNYRATHYMSQNGFYEFLNWFDDRAWYPLGRIVGGTVYPGLMITSGFIHYILNFLNFTIHIRDICVFLAPTFSGFTSIAMFLFTREIWNTRAALFSACFIAIVPGYISRSVAGSYDNEGIAIFALMFTYFLWIKSVKTGSIFWSAATSLSYFYMVSAWGGYVFIINLIPLHVFVLLLIGRYSNRLFIAYTTFFIMGLLMSMQVPFVGFQPIRTSEHMAAAGTFGLIVIYSFLKYVQSRIAWRQFKHVVVWGVASSALLLLLSLIVLTYAGFVAPWSGRFYSLYDTGYAKIHIPIIASVSEHQPTTWTSFFFDLHVLVCVFPAGLWFLMRKLNDVRVFVVLYAVSAVYFAGVMVRLMLTLTPLVCVLASISISHTLDTFMAVGGATKEESKAADKVGGASETPPNTKKLGKEKKKSKKETKDKDETTSTVKKSASSEGGDSSSSFNIGSIAILVFMMFLVLFAVHCTWVTSSAYSSPSVVLASNNPDGSRMILDDFREAYYWLRQNTPDHARVMSWWDYGYQIAGMANRTTLVDNNTWNNSHIALVGKAMSSTEEKAYDIMRMLDVDYVLIIFGGMIGYSGDDINKFLWMVRIAEGEHPNDIKESRYFTPQGEFRVDSGGSSVLLNCMMYKMCYHRFGEVQHGYGSPTGYDRTRNVEIGNKNVKLTHLEEAYTSEHWLVRIYKSVICICN
jgi:dolichyl-diphosphooligosaccharide--protein glycosyltransferase